MAKAKFDGVVQAVRYQPDGQVAWVRAYQRRGPIFSDLVILERASLIQLLKAGKQFYTGKRVAQLASTFDIDQPLRVISKNGQEILSTGDLQPDQDRLESVPLI